MWYANRRRYDICPNCGNERLNGEQENIQNDNILEYNIIRYQLKPTFNLVYDFLILLKGIFVFIFIFIFSCFFVGIMYSIIPSALIRFAILLVIIAIYMAIRLIICKRQYNNKEYNFYYTKLKYVDRYLNNEEKEVKYENIRNISMGQK